jgi:hypothetical protein
MRRGVDARREKEAGAAEGQREREEERGAVPTKHTTHARMRDWGSGSNPSGGCDDVRWTCVMWSASCASCCGSARSRRRKMRSKRLSSAAGRLMFCAIDLRVLYRPYSGFAAAKIALRAFNVVVIPAFAIDTVCCSITS